MVQVWEAIALEDCLCPDYGGKGDSDRPAMTRAKYTKDKVTARGWAYYYVFKHQARLISI
ncbi:hypothetical protein NG799_25450 [Laspinema sp. D1]|uniref:Transposase n=1 Tax=Laspinema palackyanum D2a TaxID=2953684 RepID=A0ABT2MY99_9CYAN|nr:hypothetical protein [Laspinema sp. D2a]